jgi:predicted dehydrogenase
MKFLIAGLGSIGRRHLRNLVALGEKDILLYRTHRGALEDEELAAFPVETELSAALVHKPDAVIVSNPTALHMNVAIPAAQAGCALFIEKPIASQLDELLPLEEILNYRKNKVFIAYQFRFNPGLLKVKELLEQGAIGRPLTFECFWGEFLPDWHPWEDYRQGYAARRELGGGVVLTLCHPLDYLRWLFGNVRELFAFTGTLSDLEVDVEDTADVLLQFEGGAQGSLHLDYFRRPKRHDLEISGTDGTLYWDYESSSVCLRQGAQTEQVFPAPAGFERNQMFLDEMRHFIQVVKGQAEPLCTYADGKGALELAWGILQAGRYRQRVIFH